MNKEILQADYANNKHAEAISLLMNAYASDPMGGGKALPKSILENIPKKLAEIDNAISVLAFIDGNPAGLVNCFEGFSTFACQSLLNIHDMIVLEKFRGLGLSHALMKKVEDIAKNRGCCKLTLEVLSNNTIAQSSYKKFGFSDYELDPQAGTALFWQKPI